MKKEYQIVGGTYFDARTPLNVVQVLEKARMNRTRLHISLGETEGPEAGKDWLEENMVHGVIGRSTGSIKIPLLIHNQRSLGGPGLLDHCIVRIRLSSGGKVLWQHPNYHHGKIEVRQRVQPVALRSLLVDVLRDGKVQAAFESVAKAMRYVQKLGLALA